MMIGVPAGVSVLLKAAASIETFIESRLATAGLSLPKLAALNHLAEAGEALPLGQLAERLACVKSNVTQLVHRLETDGLVERAPDPSDRRSCLAVITEAGRRARAQGVALKLDAERQVFGVLSSDDWIKLGELLQKLGGRVGDPVRERR
jgi:DNA-binding MarR family transcriptional regulator